MENKKDPKHDIRRYRSLFMMIGLNVALLMSILAFNWKSTYEPYQFPEEPENELLFLEPDGIASTQIQPPPAPEKITNETPQKPVIRSLYLQIFHRTSQQTTTMWRISSEIFRARMTK